MDFIFPDNDKVRDEAQPQLLSLFKEVVIYTHDTIFRVMSRRVEVDSFKNPEPPQVNIGGRYDSYKSQGPPRVEVGKFSLLYAFNYKADNGKITDLLIEYDKKEQEINVCMATIHLMAFSLKKQRFDSSATYFFNDRLDFLYVFKKCLYLDHGLDENDFLLAVENIYNEYMDDKFKRLGKGQMTLAMIKKARIKQPINEVWHNDDLTGRIVGLVQKPPSWRPPFQPSPSGT
jgi:hypothetical protein